MNVLIVGQGLAGTLAGHRLETAGHTVHYVDDPAAVAASDVAAGIVNPITGRRFVKSWRFDELLPEAVALYADLGQLLGGPYWLPQPLIRTLYNRGDANDWQVRTADPGYQEYMDERPETGRIPTVTEPVFAYAGVRRAGRVDVGRLVADYRARLIEHGRFAAVALPHTAIADYVDTGRLAIREFGDRQRYDGIVFSEGSRGMANPFFAATGQTNGNKGQVLIIRTAAPVLDRMFKHRVFLVPFGENTYWVGATSENQWRGLGPDEAGMTYLKDRLDEIIKVPYEILHHRAALRPTVKDRRMIIGQSPLDDRLYVFNGLGTKGASLAPLGSKWLAELVIDGVSPPAEVDYARFLA